MSKMPIKCASNEATKEPFYLIQSQGTNKRYVVSIPEKVRIRMLLAGLINQAATTVQVKVHDLDIPEKPVEYSGTVAKSHLHEMMSKHEEVIFHNGNHTFMIRVAETAEYMAFEEHGLVFIYTQKDYQEVLEKLDATYKPKEKLIYEYAHWHVSIPDGQQKLIGFIEDLGLEKE